MRLWHLPTHRPLPHGHGTLFAICLFTLSSFSIPRQASWLFALALDSTKPDAQHFDVVRLDFTGKGNFTDAHVVPRQFMFFEPPSKGFTYRYAKNPLLVRLGQRELMVKCVCVYRDRQGTDPCG